MYIFYVLINYTAPSPSHPSHLVFPSRIRVPPRTLLPSSSHTQLIYYWERRLFESFTPPFLLPVDTTGVSTSLCARLAICRRVQIVVQLSPRRGKLFPGQIKANSEIIMRELIRSVKYVCKHLVRPIRFYRIRRSFWSLATLSGCLSASVLSRRKRQQEKESSVAFGMRALNGLRQKRANNSANIRSNNVLSRRGFSAAETVETMEYV